MLSAFSVQCCMWAVVSPASSAEHCNLYTHDCQCTIKILQINFMSISVECVPHHLKGYEEQIKQFGQTPAQLLREPHPSRQPLEKVRTINRL